MNPVSVLLSRCALILSHLGFTFNWRKVSSHWIPRWSFVRKSRPGIFNIGSKGHTVLNCRFRDLIPKISLGLEVKSSGGESQDPGVSSSCDNHVFYWHLCSSTELKLGVSVSSFVSALLYKGERCQTFSPNHTNVIAEIPVFCPTKEA